MKVSEFLNKAGLKLLTSSEFEDREIIGCYIGDLLSWVMGRAESQNVWVTVMSNINIVAVASLSDVSLVVLSEDVTIDESVVKRADEQGIIIASSPKTSYEVGIDYYSLSK